jgi:hypothetical protein
VFLPVQVRIGGTLFLPEVLLAVALPVLLIDARRRGVHRVPHMFVVLAGIWLVGQILADVYAESSFEDYSRGWADIVVLISNVAALALLVDGQWNRIRILAAGLVVGQILQFYIDPGALAQGYPWKFGLGPPLTVGAALVASRQAVFRQRWVSVGIMLAFSFINLRLGYRTFAGVCFLTGLYVLSTARRDGHIRARRDQGLMHPVVVIVVAVIAVAGFIAVYSRAAASGALGTGVQQKYLAQRSSLGILLGGRPQVLADMHAIMDSPILGHGSWATNARYVRDMQEELRHAGYSSERLERVGEERTGAHSQLLGAWVYAGILGIPFWLLVAGLVTSVLTRAYWFVGRNAPLVVFVAVLSAWNLLFSPFAGEQRLLVAFYIVTLLLARSTMKNADSKRRHSEQ